MSDSRTSVSSALYTFSGNNGFVHAIGVEESGKEFAVVGEEKAPRLHGAKGPPLSVIPGAS